MNFVGMSDAGIAILATKRRVSGLPDVTVADVREAVGGHFEIASMGQGPDAANQTWEMLDADGGQDVFGLGTSADGEWLFARLSDASPMQTLAKDRSDAWRNLGVSVLHKLILDHLIQGKFPDAEQKCTYVHTLDEVNAAQSDRSCQLSCLVPPAQIEHVEQIASGFEKMPPKSTYFYPKLLSGLVFHSLK